MQKNSKFAATLVYPDNLQITRILEDRHLSQNSNFTNMKSMKRLISVLLMAMACSTAFAFSESFTDWSTGVRMYYSTISDKEVALVGCSDRDDRSSITVPSYVTKSSKKYKVVRVGKEAFKGLLYVGEIILPPEIQSIGANAFTRCIRLKKLTVPSGTKEIDPSAFYNCPALEYVSVAEGNTSFCIWAGALMDIDRTFLIICPKRQPNHFTFPKTIKEVSPYAFSNCSNLSEFTIEPGSTTAKVEDGVLYDFAMTKLLAFPKAKKVEGKFIIPATVTDIRAYAFYKASGLMDVTLPDGLKTLKEGIFRECENLRSIDLPSGLLSIEKEAFYGCGSLTKINLPTAIRQISEGAFYSCSTLTDVSWPDSLTIIQKNSFYECSKLNSVNLPKVQRIEDFAFYRCYSIKSLNLGEELCHLGGYAFERCSSIKSLKLPGSLSTIGSSCFNFCTGIESVELGDGLQTIGDRMFWGLSSLRKIEIPTSLKSIGFGAFCICGFDSIFIPDNVTEIYASAFDGCERMKTVRLPAAMNEIKEFTFYDCHSLKTVTFTGKVTSLERGAFSNCSSLDSITLQEGITEIGDQVFKGCSGLKKLSLPSTLTTIGDEAFAGCNSLAYVVNYATVPQTITDKVFSTYDTLCVPTGSVQAYMSAYGWQRFYVTGGADNGVESIANGEEVYPVGYYTPDGMHVDENYSGIVIVKMSDGTTRKVLR